MSGKKVYGVSRLFSSCLYGAGVSVLLARYKFWGLGQADPRTVIDGVALITACCCCCRQPQKVKKLFDALTFD